MKAAAGIGRLDADNDPGVLKRRSVRGAAITFTAQAARFVLQFGSQIVLARMLLPRDFGLVAMIGPIISFVQIFNELGLTQATVQRAEITQDEISALFWVNLAISLVLTLALCAAAPVVALFYGDTRLTPITICLACLLLLGGLAAQQIALMNRAMRFVPLAAIDIACLAVAVAVGIAAAGLGMGYWSLVLMQAANSVTIVVLAWVASPWRPSRPRWNRDIGGLLRFGGHLTGFNIVGYIGGNLDSIVIGRVSGAGALGLFDRSVKLVVTPMWQASLPVARVAVALLSRLRGADEQYARAYLRMLQVLLLATAPGFVWVAAASDTLTPALFGAAWVGAVPLVSWMAIAAAFSPFSISTYWLFVSQDRVREQLRYGTARTAFTVLALGVGLPWGVKGVAVSYAAFALLVHGSVVWGATRSGPVTLPAILRASYPIVAGAVLSGMVLVVVHGHAGSSGLSAPLRLVAELALSYAASGAALLCLPGGRTMLREAWALRSAFRRTRLPAIIPDPTGVENQIRERIA